MSRIELLDALSLVRALIKGYEDTRDDNDVPVANNAMRAGWVLDEIVANLEAQHE